MKNLKPVLLTLMAVITANLCLAQSDTIYYNKDWYKCNRTEALYYRLIIKNTKVSYTVTDYFISNNQPQMVAEFLSLNPEQKNGPCTYYRENGEKKSEGVYKKNNKVDQWIFWDEGRQDSSIQNFKTDGTTTWIRRSEQQKKKDEESEFISVEHMPTFPGGDVALKTFLKRNLSYPSEAIKQNIKGDVMVEFLVSADGSLRNIKILHDIGGGCGDETIRLVKIMPAWNPGKQGGVGVNVKMVIPVTFKLDKGAKESSQPEK